MAAGNLVIRASAPLPFYIARATGAHQPYGLDAPDQGVFKGSGPIFGSGPWRSTPTAGIRDFDNKISADRIGVVAGSNLYDYRFCKLHKGLRV